VTSGDYSRGVAGDANGNHIVACVNACAGINPAAVPLMHRMCLAAAVELRALANTNPAHTLNIAAGCDAALAKAAEPCL
jgi:hypothetical protein